jgi:hypothetical protein
MAANHEDGLVGTASSGTARLTHTANAQSSISSPFVPWALLSSPSPSLPLLDVDLTIMDYSSSRHTVRSSSTNFAVHDAHLDIAPQDYLDQGPAGNPPMFDNVDPLKLAPMNHYKGK